MELEYNSKITESINLQPNFTCSNDIRYNLFTPISQLCWQSDVDNFHWTNQKKKNDKRVIYENQTNISSFSTLLIRKRVLIISVLFFFNIICTTISFTSD